MLPRGNPKFRRPVSLRWSLTGILFLLVMFGHDALMAAAPMAAPVGSLGTAAVDVSDGDAVHAAFGEATGLLLEAHVSHADVECGVNTNPATSPSRFVSIPAIPVAISLPDPPVPANHVPGSSVDRILHPSVRRALLQVYLI